MVLEAEVEMVLQEVLLVLVILVVVPIQADLRLKINSEKKTISFFGIVLFNVWY